MEILWERLFYERFELFVHRARTRLWNSAVPKKRVSPPDKGTLGFEDSQKRRGAYFLRKRVKG